MLKENDNPSPNLPLCVTEYIKTIIKEMGWRQEERGEVEEELITHFEDALKDLKSDKEREKAAQELITNFGDAKVLGVLSRRAKKRCRPLWQKILIGIIQISAIIIGLFIIYTIWFLSGKPKITKNYVAELNRMVKPAGAEDSQNAAIYYNQASGQIEKLPDNLNKIFAKSYYECNEPERKSASDWLAQNREVIKLVSAGSQKPYYWQKYESDNNQILSALLPHISPYKKLVKIMDWNIQSLTEQKNYSQALQNIIAIYKFGKHLRTEPVIIGQLVGISFEAQAADNLRKIISRYNIGVPELKKLQDELQDVIGNETFKINFTAEELCIYDELQRCFTDDFLGSGHIYPQHIFELALQPGEKNRLAKMLIILEAMCRNPGRKETFDKSEQLLYYYDKVLQLSPAQQKRRNINIEDDLKKIRGNNLFLKTLSPGIGKLVTLGYRIKADVQATETIIAIILYKDDNGDYPDNLEQLFEKRYIIEIPIDPYRDSPLVYKKTKNNFTLYSVGSDFKDDGGKAYKPKSDEYITWADANGCDLVFWPPTTP